MTPFSMVFNIITCPGTLTYVLARVLVGSILRVSIRNVDYLHGCAECDEHTDFARGGILIVSVWIVNTLLCALLTFSAWTLAVFDAPVLNVCSISLGWIGLSIGMHALPSDSDGRNLYASAQDANYGIARWLVDLVAIMKVMVLDRDGRPVLAAQLGWLLRFLWMDAAYALQIMILLGLAFYGRF